MACQCCCHCSKSSSLLAQPSWGANKGSHEQCTDVLERMGLGPCLLLALHSYLILHITASVCWAAHWAAEIQTSRKVLPASWRVGFSSPELFSVTPMGVRGVCRGAGGYRAGLGKVGLSLLPGQLCCAADVACTLFWCLCCRRDAEWMLGDSSTLGCHSSAPPWLEWVCDWEKNA